MKQRSRRYLRKKENRKHCILSLVNAFREAARLMRQMQPAKHPLPRYPQGGVHLGAPAIIAEHGVELILERKEFTPPCVNVLPNGTLISPSGIERYDLPGVKPSLTGVMMDTLKKLNHIGNTLHRPQVTEQPPAEES